MKVWRITKYNERHEDQASRKVKRLNYVQAPTNQNSRGWKRLKMRGEFHVIGIYQVIYEFSATLPIRGLLADEAPMTLDDIAVLADIPYADLERGWKVLTDPAVGFIDEIDWPVDPRLIHVTTARGEVKSEIILPWLIDQDGKVIDQNGVSIDQNGPTFDRQSIETRYTIDRGANEVPKNTVGGAQPKHEPKHEPELEQEHEQELERFDSKGSNFSGDSDSGSASPADDAARRLAWVKVQAAITPLLGRHGGAGRHLPGSRQHNADVTCLRQWWDEFIWPDGDPACEASTRVGQFIAIVEKAKTAKKPMAYITAMMRKQEAA